MSAPVITTWPDGHISPAPCSGCGHAYITASANPMYPHNEAECVAFKRGYEAGKAEALRTITSQRMTESPLGPAYVAGNNRAVTMLEHLLRKS